jgi:GGDEF domain-containing protein
MRKRNSRQPSVRFRARKGWIVRSFLCFAAAWGWMIVAVYGQSTPAAASYTPVATSYTLPSLFSNSDRLQLTEPMGWLAWPADNAPAPEQFIQEPGKFKFHTWQPGISLPTSKEQDVWLRLVLPASESPQTWVLRIPRLTLQKASVYTPTAQGWQVRSAGFRLANRDWPMRSRDAAFDLTTRPGQTQLFIIRIEHLLPVTENIQLIHSTEFANGANHAGTVNGIIIGVFAILSLAGALSAWVNRSSHFIWFALFNLTVMLAQLTLSGYMILRVWPGSLYLPQTMGWVMPYLSLAAFARFAMSVSYAKDLSRRVNALLWTVISMCAVAIGATLTWPLDLPLPLMNSGYALGLLTIMGSLAWIAWRSQNWLWPIVISLIPVALSVFARLAYNMGWVAHMELALLAGVISTALGLLFVYTALVIHQRDKLTSAQRHLSLDSNDASTGLFSERIAMARLPQVILRSKRFEQACGVILIRWVDFEAVMALASSTARGRIFAHLGNRLSRPARDIDTVARIADDMFIFLIESPITREDLNALTSTLLATCLRPSQVMPDSKGFDLHLAVWLSSELPAEAEQVLELLKTRINQMRSGAQRRVQYVSTPLTTGAFPEKDTAAQAAELVAKINSLEATQGLPTIDLSPRTSSKPSLNQR